MERIKVGNMTGYINSHGIMITSSGKVNLNKLSEALKPKQSYLIYQIRQVGKLPKSDK